MASRNAASSQPVHWSKDYVEHLRTVHLTLVAVSLAVLIIMLSARPYRPAVAVRELHQILELKKLWSPQWIRSKGTHKDIHLKYDDTMEKKYPGLTTKVSVQSEIKDLSARVYFPERKRAKRVEDVLLIFPAQNYAELNPDGERVAAVGFPETLNEFERWWNNLSKPVQLYAPKIVLGTLAFQTPNHDSGELALRHSRLEPNQGTPNYSAEINLLLEHNKWDDPDEQNVRSMWYSSIQHDSKSGEVYHCDLEVTNAEETTLDRTNLAAYFGNWRIDGYRRSFADLREAAKEFGSLELEDQILEVSSVRDTGAIFLLPSSNVRIRENTSAKVPLPPRGIFT